MVRKYGLLAGVLTLAGPAFAQTAPTQAGTDTQPAQEAVTKAQTDATTAQPAAGTQPQASAAQPGTTTPGNTTPPATPSASTPPAPTPPAQQATPETAQASGGGQVAQVVDQEFASHDTDQDGKLDKTEFGAWMVKLKTINDPSTKPGTPQTIAWVNGAFAQADADRNRALTKRELTGFLSQGRS